MSRPFKSPEEKRAHISATIPADIAQYINTAAKRDGVTFSEMITRITIFHRDNTASVEKMIAEREAAIIKAAELDQKIRMAEYGAGEDVEESIKGRMLGYIDVLVRSGVKYRSRVMIDDISLREKAMGWIQANVKDISMQRGEVLFREVWTAYFDVKEGKEKPTYWQQLGVERMLNELSK